MKSLFKSLLITMALFLAMSLSALFLGAFEHPLVSVVGFIVVWVLIFGLFEG